MAGEQLDNITDALKSSERVSKPWLDELRIYKASIYKTCGPQDDRLQVRILPYMKDISSDELDNLPKYPTLQKGTVIAGYSEKEDGIDKASRVYVAATPDFTVGYVLCLANQFESNTKSAFSGSYNFKSIKRFISARGCLPTDFAYKDLQVMVSSFENGTGGIIIMYNVRTGDFFIINSTGTIITAQKNKIYLRVGSPSNPASGNSNFSHIEMTASKIDIKTQLLCLNAKNTIMGKHGLYLCGTNAEIAVPSEQITFVPMKNVMV